jgi:hypothetical protein
MCKVGNAELSQPEQLKLLGAFASVLSDQSLRPREKAKKRAPGPFGKNPGRVMPRDPFSSAVQALASKRSIVPPASRPKQLSVSQCRVSNNYSVAHIERERGRL